MRWVFTSVNLPPPGSIPLHGYSQTLCGLRVGGGGGWLPTHRPGIQSDYHSKKGFHLPRRAYVYARMTFQALSFTPGFAACLRVKGEPIALSNELLQGSCFLHGPFLHLLWDAKSNCSLKETTLSRIHRGFFPRVQTWLMGENSTFMVKFWL